MKKLTISAFLITLLIFLIILGISLIFENGRSEEIRKSMTEVDVLWNDARFFNRYITSTEMTEDRCGFLTDENFRLGDRIYDEGLKIERYEGANRLTDALLTEKKRYALLDLQFWENSMEVKKACNSSFSTVVYFYSQYNRTDDQKIMDRVLVDFKERCGRATVYITFPDDMGLSSIEFAKNIYNITKAPSIMINEETVMTGAATLEELNSYAHCW